MHDQNDLWGHNYMSLSLGRAPFNFTPGSWETTRFRIISGRRCSNSCYHQESALAADAVKQDRAFQHRVGGDQQETNHKGTGIFFHCQS